MAVTFAAASSVSVHAPVPEQAPLQPPKVKPEAGVAVSTMLVPPLKVALQVLPQLRPAGVLVTVPDPAVVMERR
ncbi:MAG: hypothetical protein D4S02_16570 [Rhodocyclaceae bacterium]|nr:MAG: hypothetical protein D4S02_16570 [Rhodocyclaceae bacterium]